uniref:Protein kinase domain-containing protein n=3 Tax=Brassica TaxID=3705 RepID=A0A0D3DU78_BRAOL
MAGVGPMTQDWEPVVIRKRAPNSAAKRDEKTVNAARRSGADIESVRKFNAGTNKAASSSTSLNTKRLDDDTETLAHERVPTELKKAIMQARGEKKLTQSQLAQLINEKPQVIQEYESGKAIPNQQILSKLERALGAKLRGKKNKLYGQICQHPVNTSILSASRNTRRYSETVKLTFTHTSTKKKTNYTKPKALKFLFPSTVINLVVVVLLLLLLGFPHFLVFSISGNRGGEMETDEAYQRKERDALVAIVVLACLALTSLFVAFSYYCYIRNKVSKRHRINKKFNCEEKGDCQNQQEVTDNALQIFTFKQLHSATGGFSKSNVVGHGGFGLVYRGVLNDGRKVAIKLMDNAGKQGEDEFKMEVELLSRLRSPYLLALLGYCSDNSHKLLVYEFMANGGLQEHLYPTNRSGSVPLRLDWETRMRIALEAAKGLEYLHEQVSPPVIHRDFKSSNILLDRNFHAKVSDFGLAKVGSDKAGGHVSTRVLGTQGYVAPEYALTGHLTTKSDVYSYGIVLLELLTGRVPVDMKRDTGEGVLVSWALPQLADRDKVVDIMDSTLEGQYSTKEVVQVAAIAAMCVQAEADYRPLMADVVQSLVPLVRSRRSAAKLSGCSSSFSLARSLGSPVGSQ